jgi:hypothetical protein
MDECADDLAGNPYCDALDSGFAPGRPARCPTSDYSSGSGAGGGLHMDR